MSHVLVIDDDSATCEVVADAVRRIGHDVCCAYSFREGLEKSHSREFAVVLVDVQLPDGNGLKLLPRLRQEVPCPEVIIMTSHGDPDGAELAIRNGAWDYLQKPSALENIALTIKRALQYQETKKQTVLPVALKRDRIVGNSLAINGTLFLDEIGELPPPRTEGLSPCDSGKTISTRGWEERAREQFLSHRGDE